MGGNRTVIDIDCTTRSLSKLPYNLVPMLYEDSRVYNYCGPLSRNERGRFGALKSDSTHHFFRNACTKSGSLRFSVFRLLIDFVCLYTYEFWLSLCKIVRSSVILLLPLFIRPMKIWSKLDVLIICISFLFIY